MAGISARKRSAALAAVVGRRQRTPQHCDQPTLSGPGNRDGGRFAVRRGLTASPAGKVTCELSQCRRIAAAGLQSSASV
jgi:hypothetical protein